MCSGAARNSWNMKKNKEKHQGKDQKKTSKLCVTSARKVPQTQTTELTKPTKEEKGEKGEKKKCVGARDALEHQPFCCLKDWMEPEWCTIATVGCSGCG